ncbi:hypothetical protein [Caulobacter soli]|uniref:hypothetical protein n=1 Tax=Caulobacter soli TaxID=2708539 RepID=UPI0013EA5F1C|nr:hypothetical protein [Caulobacter soli]
MIGFLHAINPAKPINTEEDARGAARAGAWGAFLMATPGAIGALCLLFTIDSYLARTRAAMIATYGADDPVREKMLLMLTPQFVYLTAGASLVFALIIGILGVVQWKKPSLTVPLILGLFTAYGLVMLSLNLANHEVMTAATKAMAAPMWRNVLAGVVDVMCLVLFWAGFRGGKWLDDLRRRAG